VTAWTPDREARLRQLFADGATDAVMAEALGTSRNAVIGRRWQMHLLRKVSVPAKRRISISYQLGRKLRTLYADKARSLTQIALNLGLSESQVRRRVAALGLPGRSSPIKRKNAPVEPAGVSAAGPIPAHGLGSTSHAADPMPATARLFPPLRSCQWIEGNDKGTWTMCGDAVVPGRSYCLPHCRRCYVTRSALGATGLAEAA